ncbi:unnamed protein product [Rhizophagus irregularis]|nr:unnamed protein product [Rhizophagus irregularis]
MSHHVTFRIGKLPDYAVVRKWKECKRHNEPSISGQYNSWICWDPKEKNKYNRRVVKSNLDEIDDDPADLQRNCGRQSP